MVSGTRTRRHPSLERGQKIRWWGLLGSVAGCNGHTTRRLRIPWIYRICLRRTSRLQLVLLTIWGIRVVGLRLCNVLMRKSSIERVFLCTFIIITKHKSNSPRQHDDRYPGYPPISHQRNEPISPLSSIHQSFPPQFQQWDPHLHLELSNSQ